MLVMFRIRGRDVGEVYNTVTVMQDLRICDCGLFYQQICPRYRLGSPKTTTLRLQVKLIVHIIQFPRFLKH